MLDSSSDISNVSREWKMKAEQTLRLTNAELDASNSFERTNLRKQKAATDFIRSAQQTRNTMAMIEREIEDNYHLGVLQTKSQIESINEQVQREKDTIDLLQAQHQEAFQKEISEKNEIWEQTIIQAREDEAKYQTMVSQLTSAISIARNEAQTDIQEAKRKAEICAKQIRQTREEQIIEISRLTDEINAERARYRDQIQRIHDSNQAAYLQRKEQKQRLEKTLLVLQRKLKDKDAQIEIKFKRQLRDVSDLKMQLQRERNIEKDKQNELISLKKQCAAIQRKISAHTDEIASIKRQITMVNKDNEELQNEMFKLESQMFPQVFQSLEL